MKQCENAVVWVKKFAALKRASETGGRVVRCQGCKGWHIQ